MALADSFCSLLFNHYLFTVVVYRHINVCALVRINIILCLVLKAFTGQSSGNWLSFNISSINCKLQIMPLLIHLKEK